MTDGKPRHFSMIRGFVAADFLTLGNGFAGTGIILALMQWIATSDERLLWTAFALFPSALVLDFADGRVARWRHKKSGLGKDLDSLADVISFGVAPAALAFRPRTALAVVGRHRAALLRRLRHLAARALQRHRRRARRRHGR